MSDLSVRSTVVTTPLAGVTGVGDHTTTVRTHQPEGIPPVPPPGVDDDSVPSLAPPLRGFDALGNLADKFLSLKLEISDEQIKGGIKDAQDKGATIKSKNAEINGKLVEASKKAAEAEKAKLAMKVLSWIAVALSVLFAVFTGGAGAIVAAAVAVTMATLNETGVMQKLTDSIAKSLQAGPPEMSSTEAKNKASWIMMGITLAVSIATLGAGFASGTSAVANAGAKLAELGTKIAERITTAIDTIKTALQNFQPLMQVLAKAGDIAGKVGETASTVMEAVMQAMRTAMSRLSDILQLMRNSTAVTQSIEKMTEIGTKVREIVSQVMDALRPAMDKLSDIMQALKGSGAVTDAVGAGAEAVAKAREIMAQVMAAMQRVLDSLPSATRVMDALSTVADKVKDVTQIVPRAMGEMGQRAASAAKAGEALTQIAQGGAGVSAGLNQYGAANLQADVMTDKAFLRRMQQKLEDDQDMVQSIMQMMSDMTGRVIEAIKGQSDTMDNIMMEMRPQHG